MPTLQTPSPITSNSSAASASCVLATNAASSTALPPLILHAGVSSVTFTTVVLENLVAATEEVFEDDFQEDIAEEAGYFIISFDTY
jgi:hypothetical protein